MVLMVGRIKIGLMSMIANVVPLIMIFGIMGIASIPLDMVTIIIGSLVLGLVVDDTMHFLHHFRRAYDQSHNVAEAVKLTLYTTGRAMVTTSLVLCGGFFIYTTAYLSANVNFGILSGCAVIFALVADFLLVPALLTLVYDRQPPAPIRNTPHRRNPTSASGNRTQKESLMKHCLKISFHIVVLVLVVFSIQLWADDPKAREIMERVDARKTGDNQSALIEMLLTDKHDKQRSRSIQSFQRMSVRIPTT